MLHASNKLSASLTVMHGKESSAATVQAPPDDAIGEIQSALHSLSRSLKRGRLHDYLLDQARVDCDQSGLAVLYVLHSAGTSLRLTDLAERLHIDAPGVTRKAQQLERAGLVSRTQDQADARATRIQATPQGRRMIARFLSARRAWLTDLLSSWPEAERAEFARLLGRFVDDLRLHLEELPD